jgi:hypothetical protein
MRRLIAADMVPAQAGQPAKVIAHISLADLIDLDADSGLLNEWTSQVRTQWAAARAAASDTGDGGAWLEGNAAEAFASDATIMPVVTCEVQLTALDDLVRLCLELGGHGHGHYQPCHPENEHGSAHPGSEHGSISLTDRSREALEQAIIGKTKNLLMHSM